MGTKWTSRKLWMALGGMIVTVAVGLGYQLDPQLIVVLTAGESFLWILIEGILDIVRSRKGHPSLNRFASRKFLVAIMSMATLIALGFGYELNPVLIAAVVAPQGAVWLIIQGILDGMGLKPEGGGGGES